MSFKSWICSASCCAKISKVLTIPLVPWSHFLYFSPVSYSGGTIIILISSHGVYIVIWQGFIFSQGLKTLGSFGKCHVGEPTTHNLKLLHAEHHWAGIIGPQALNEMNTPIRYFVCMPALLKHFHTFAWGQEWCIKPYLEVTKIVQWKKLYTLSHYEKGCDIMLT